MPAASTENAAIHADAIYGPPATSSATPTPHAPSADRPKPTVECIAIVVPRSLGLPPSSCPRSVRRIGRNRDGVDQNQRQQQPGRLVCEHSDQNRHRAELNMIGGIARWRPIFSATSLPSMLAGMARTENTTLITIGVGIDRPEFRIDHKGPERHDPGSDAVQLKAVRAVSEHKSHGSAVSQHRRKIHQASLHRLRFDRPQQQTGGYHHKRTGSGDKNAVLQPQSSATSWETRNDTPTPSEKLDV